MTPTGREEKDAVLGLLSRQWTTIVAPVAASEFTQADAVRAAAAVLNLGGDEVRKAFSCMFFVGGIVLAMLSGQLGTLVNVAAAPHFSKRAGYWLSVMADGERVESFESTMRDEGKLVVAKGDNAKAAGYGSIACFVGGCIIAVFAAD